MSKDIRKEIAGFAKGLVKPCLVLDVGCGLRPYEEFFDGCSYTGIDTEESGRASSGKKADTFFDGLHIPFEDNCFDIVLCTQVLEHCIDASLLLAEIRRVLKPGGRLLLTVPFLWGEHETPYDFRRYSSFGIKKAVTEAGLRVERYSKITPGIRAMETLVNSEIQNSKRMTRDKVSTFRRIKEQLASLLWRATLYLWRRLYNFERVYLDNLIVAQKAL